VSGQSKGLQEREEFSARLQKVLGLDGSPVAEALLNEVPEGIQQWQGEPAWVCGMAQDARRGSVYYITKENISCAPGATFMGLGPTAPIGIVSDYVTHAKKLYRSRAASYRHLEDSWKMIPKMGGKYLVFAPLEKATFQPQAVLFVVNPMQAMRIMFLDAYQTGFHDLAPYNEPFCLGVMAGAITTGKMTLGMLCPGSRHAAKFKPEECAVCVPYERMARIVSSIEGSHLGTATPDGEAGSKILGYPHKLSRLADLDRHLK
jgi:uncharacterized protein (DUF169 family)